MERSGILRISSRYFIYQLILSHPNKSRGKNKECNNNNFKLLFLKVTRRDFQHSLEFYRPNSQSPGPGAYDDSKGIKAIKERAPEWR